jgi:hypothetical protein
LSPVPLIEQQEQEQRSQSEEESREKEERIEMQLLQKNENRYYGHFYTDIIPLN